MADDTTNDGTKTTGSAFTAMNRSSQPAHSENAASSSTRYQPIASAPEAPASTPPDDLTPQQPAAKRRRTGGGSGNGSGSGPANSSSSSQHRWVANLTPEQLARKRANDREAQRAIRERTRNTIETLSARIRELETQNPYRELQRVMQERDSALTQNVNIKKRLANAMALLQPLLSGERGGVEAAVAGKGSERGAQGLDELAAAAVQSPLAGQHLQSHAPAQEVSGDNGQQFRPIRPLQKSQIDSRAPHSGSPEDEASSAPSRNANSIGATSPREERLGVEFLLQRRGSGDNAYTSDDNADSRAGSVPQGGLGDPSYRLGLPPTAHKALPFALPPTCALDQVVLDFIMEAKRGIVGGAPISSIIGPSNPDLRCLLRPESQPQSPESLTSVAAAAAAAAAAQQGGGKGKDPGSSLNRWTRVFTGIGDALPVLDGLPERVALIFVAFMFLRWIIDPTSDKYDRLTDWVSPRPSQLLSGHPAWMDFIPWPRLRDRMVQSTPHISFDDFFVPFFSSLKVEWAQQAQDVLLPTLAPRADAEDDGAAGPGPSSLTSSHVSVPEEQWVINPAFETQLRKLENWSLGPEFERAFPDLADTVKLRET
ncbi:hypothetical protein BDY21DRAFT_366881 [Lineolata rhizophorae]|uniref:BZIP transcription factor n=1 Tax=Lineolata rhizophorae TaxID=578093 RepID=A0A6A6NPE7_9PEZI|nr:hypothetical protein BDY21DRAFT_366881 [Lineolata rhizophorae]